MKPIFFLFALSTGILICSSCNRNQSDVAFKIRLTLDMPDTVPFAIQHAIFKSDPVEYYKSKIKSSRDFIINNRYDLQYSLFWDMIFDKVTGNKLPTLVSNPTGVSLISGNYKLDKAWIVTKTSYYKGKNVCWAIPVKLVHDSTAIVLSKANMLDIESIFNETIK